jgi:cell division protein FtsI/penicillin-binding protein 2
VRPRDVKNARAIQTFLAKAAGQNAVSRFKAGRSRHAAYIRLSSQLSPQQELALQATTLPEGLRVEAVPGRVYPLETVARSVIGVVGSEGDGLEGLERMYDRELKGKSGWATLFCDARGAAYELPRSLVKVPESGESIVSTIDLDAQSIAAIELRKAVEKNGAKGGMAVFADPRTGDILAMVTVDAAGRTDSDQHRNRVISDQYEPGSTFKVLAGCAALEERLLQPSDSFYVDKGEADVGGFTIHDSHPETRWYTFRDATALSSNVCYAHIGTKVGAKTLYGYARLFGFGQPTRIMLPGEAPGQIRHPDRWTLARDHLDRPGSARDAAPDPDGLLRDRERRRAPAPARRLDRGGRSGRAGPRDPGGARAARRLVRDRAHVPLLPARRGGIGDGGRGGAPVVRGGGEDRHRAEGARERARLRRRLLHLLVRRHGSL